jgi:hypothetical protein
VRVQLEVGGERVRVTMSVVSDDAAAKGEATPAAATKPSKKAAVAAAKPPSSSRSSSGGGSSSRRASSASTERTGCGEGCLNRKLMMFCDPRVCPSGKTCSNLPWNNVASPSLVPFDTRDRGWGVKAGERLHQGQFLIEYVGELIDDKEVERRLWEVSAALCLLSFGAQQLAERIAASQPHASQSCEK